MEDIPSLFPEEFSLCLVQARACARRLIYLIINYDEYYADVDDDVRRSICGEYATFTREFCPNIGDDICGTVFSEVLHRVFEEHGL